MSEKKKVMIVGFAPSWKEVPWQDDVENTEIWCLNEFYKVVEQNKLINFRCDRWFEIHDLNSSSKNTPEHIKFLQQCPVPLYLQKKFVSEEYPNSRPLPLNEIIEHFEGKGYAGSRYFVSSISLLLAYAIYEGFKEISVYGVDLATEQEYGWQRPSAEYWLGVCEGLGIKLYIPQSSELLKCGQIYGFESNNKISAWVKAQIGELGKRGQHFALQEEQAAKATFQAQIAQAEIRGAKSAYGEILKRRQ